MDDATQGLNEILNWSGDFNSQSYALAGSIASAMLRSSPDIRSLGIGH